MARQTFTLLPTFESEASMKPEVTVTKFGDGYEARQGNGINFKKEVWDLTFDGVSAPVEAANDFLVARGAVESFYWMNPRGVTLTVVCDEWSIKRYPGYRTLTAQFRQVFEQ